MSTHPNAFDYAQFRILLSTYFKLNSRGHLSRPYGQQGKNIHYFWTLCFYVMMGAVTGMMLFSFKDLAASLLVIHSMTFMFILMIAILESSQVLFNPQEEDILGHRPISARTLLAAKIANMISITLIVALAFNLAPMFYVLAIPDVYPWAPLAHLITVCLICVFCSAWVVFIYGLMTRWVGRERFQTLVTWCQIVMMVIATFGYQFAMRSMDFLNPKVILASLPYLAPLPPVWFVGLEASLALHRPDLPLVIFGIVALVLTPVLAWTAVMRLSDLQGRISSSLVEKSPVAPKNHAARVSQRPLHPILQVWLRHPVERGAFCLAATLIRRERYIMQQIYPQLAFVVAFPLLMILPSGHHGHSQAASPATFIFFAVWMLATLPGTALEVLRTGENTEASVLFSIAPLDGAGRLFLGMRKAVMVYLVLPVTLAMLLIGGLLLHLKPADILIALPVLVTLPIFSLMPGMGRRSFIPLSSPAGRGNKSARVAGTFLTMMLTGLVIGASWLCKEKGWLPWLLAGEIPLVLLIHQVMIRRILRPRPIRMGHDAD